MLYLRFVVLAAIGLAGCSIHPVPEDFSGVSTSDIVQAIRCEARQAIREYAPDPMFDNGAIAFDFTFDMTEDNSASAGATFLKPFSNVSSFTLGLGGTGGTVQRRTTRKFAIVNHFSELKALSCDNPAPGARPLYPITGSIGLREVIRTFIALERTGAVATDSDQNDQTQVGGTVDFADDLLFTTTLNTGTLTPNLVLAPVTGAFRLTNLTGSFSADRKDVHEVVVALAMPPLPAITQNASLQGAASRAAAQSVSGGHTGGVPSKLALATETSTKAKALAILDRHRVLSQNDNLVQAIAGLQPQ